MTPFPWSHLANTLDNVMVLNTVYSSNLFMKHAMFMIKILKKNMHQCHSKLPGAIWHQAMSYNSDDFFYWLWYCHGYGGRFWKKKFNITRNWHWGYNNLGKLYQLLMPWLPKAPSHHQSVDCVRYLGTCLPWGFSMIQRGEIWRNDRLYKHILCLMGNIW